MLRLPRPDVVDLEQEVGVVGGPVRRSRAPRPGATSRPAGTATRRPCPARSPSGSGASKWVPVCSPVRKLFQYHAGPRSSYLLISSSSNRAVCPNSGGSWRIGVSSRQRCGEVDDLHGTAGEVGGKAGQRGHGCSSGVKADGVPSVWRAGKRRQRDGRAGGGRVLSRDSAALPDNGPVRVLVVEDEERLGDAIRRGLVAEGFVVDVETNGADGLWAAQNHPYDVIVLDIMLPKLNGYDVCKQLRADENWTPVIMLTAKDGDLDQVDAFDLGADDYLTKPFAFAVLVARLRALVRRGAPARPVVLTAGDLSLDPAARSVHRGDVAIELTPREYGLLHYLIRHPGEVMSKADILENVWDAYYEGDDNVVEVYVGYLRRKIDQPFGRHAIQTQRGMGYRLEADGG